MRADPSRNPWIEKAARAGYVAKGVIYALVGGLAIASVVTASSGSVGGGQNAVETIAHQTFGQLLLVLIGAGLFAYALWRLIQAYFDPENAQADEGGTLKRVGYVASGAVHAFLGVAAFQMAFGSGGAQTGSQKQSYLADLIAVDTVGPILAVAAGVAVLGFALYQLYKAATVDFTDELKTGEMPGRTQTWVIRVARFGLAARGAVFLLIGVGLVKAGLSTRAGEARGLGEALRDIGSQPFGAILLVIVAAGLAAYGAYQVTLAKYRRIPA